MMYCSAVQPRIIRRSFVVDVQSNSTSNLTSNSTKGRVRRYPLGHTHKRKLFPILEEANMYTTNDDKDFVLGYGGYIDRVVLLGTKEFFQKLCTANIIFMDGFKINLECKLFKYLYTFHCFVGEKIITTTYALLYDNSKEAYSKMFQIMRFAANNIKMKFNPSNIYIDVNFNLIPAIEEILMKEITIKLSLYHYANSIWHKVNSLGLSQNDDVNIEKTTRRMSFLSMIPVEQIDDIWIKIKEEAPQNENLSELISYITETFMISKGGHKFNKTVWNHYNTENIIKTINLQEGWNDFINEDINKSDLSIKNFILKLKNKNLDFEMEIITNQKKSNEFSSIPKKFKTIEEKFKHAKERFENGTTSAIEYLDEMI